MFENVLIEQFVKNFNMEILARDLVSMIDKNKLIEFIINEFNNNFTYGELFDLFNGFLAKQDLKKLLEKMEHNFIDLDKLEDKEKYKYY